MRIQKLLTDDDAVSPVIGVILMVAITVILAAVIASFVLGLGNTQSATPTVSFNTDYTEATSDDGNLTITHDSGETVRANEIIIRGQNGSNGGNAITSYNTPWVAFANASGYAPTANTAPESLYADSTASHARYEGTNSSDISGEPAVSSGDFIRFPVGSDADLDVVYVPADGGSTATLTEFTGPDA
ncbi:type IV pilin [Halorientalis litorea]|uniref:type IV pilin n=1 Tax=Halorientalis litorea TaxID=2931977 RepID=UPI002110EAC5|nr:type IV pilin N-terminal domain-containing protein [Halorientalis litorea]